MFLSGLQIDRWGNCNVTALGYPNITMKLPGGGGGGNLSCDAAHVTLWTTAHRSPEDAKGRRRFRLVEDCDFITNLGHRTSMTDGRHETRPSRQWPAMAGDRTRPVRLRCRGHMRV